MKITKSHLRKIIQEELREMTDVGAAMSASGGGVRDEEHSLMRSYVEEMVKAMLSLDPPFEQLHNIANPEVPRKHNDPWNNLIDDMTEAAYKAMSDRLKHVPFRHNPEKQ